MQVYPLLLPTQSDAMSLLFKFTKWPFSSLNSTGASIRPVTLESKSHSLRNGWNRTYFRSIMYVDDHRATFHRFGCKSVCCLSFPLFFNVFSSFINWSTLLMRNTRFLSLCRMFDTAKLSLWELHPMRGFSVRRASLQLTEQLSPVMKSTFSSVLWYSLNWLMT